jgi:hypothetical protein
MIFNNPNSVNPCYPSIWNKKKLVCMNDSYSIVIVIQWPLAICLRANCGMLIAENCSGLLPSERGVDSWPEDGDPSRTIPSLWRQVPDVPNSSLWIVRKNKLNVIAGRSATVWSIENSSHFSAA